MKTPYQEARARKLPYVVLRVDYRTADPDGPAIKMSGPVTLKQAKRLGGLIVAILKEKGEPL